MPLTSAPCFRRPPCDGSGATGPGADTRVLTRRSDVERGDDTGGPSRNGHNGRSRTRVRVSFAAARMLTGTALALVSWFSDFFGANRGRNQPPIAPNSAPKTPT